MEAQRKPGFRRVTRKWLYGRFLLGYVIALVIFVLVFWSGFLSAIQLQDRGDANFPDAPLHVRLDAFVLPAAQFAFHLDMCALGERPRKLRELAEDHATVPFGVRDVLLVLLVGG